VLERKKDKDKGFSYSVKDALLLRIFSSNLTLDNIDLLDQVHDSLLKKKIPSEKEEMFLRVLNAIPDLSDLFLLDKVQKNLDLEKSNNKFISLKKQLLLDVINSKDNL